MQLKLVIVGGNAEEWIDRCLSSVSNQIDSNWEACVVLDPVGDKTIERAQKYASDKIKVIANETQQFQNLNFLKAIKQLDPDDEDVIVLGPDADDWLYNNKALATVRKYYETYPKLLATYGGLARFMNNKLQFFSDKIVQKHKTFSKEQFDSGIRKYWSGCHLKTMKYKLFKRIKYEDILDPQGKPLQVNGDMAVMVPIFEMARFDRTKRINEIIYVYNHSTPFMDEKCKKEEQLITRAYLESKTPYERFKD